MRYSVMAMLVFVMGIGAGCTISNTASDLRGIKGVDGAGNPLGLGEEADVEAVEKETFLNCNGHGVHQEGGTFNGH